MSFLFSNDAHKFTVTGAVDGINAVSKDTVSGSTYECGVRFIPT